MKRVGFPFPASIQDLLWFGRWVALGLAKISNGEQTIQARMTQRFICHVYWEPSICRVNFILAEKYSLLPTFAAKKSAGIQHFYPPGHGTRFFKPQLSAHCFGGTTAKKTSTDDMARSGLLTTVVPLGRSRGADCTGEQEV